jgi:hypothetical protein
MATSTRSRSWWWAAVVAAALVIAIAAMFYATRNPAPPSASASATPSASPGLLPTATALAGGGVNGGLGNGNAGAGNGGAGNGGNGPGASPGATPGQTPEASPTDSPTPPDHLGGPYAVKQIETLGGEVISGQVCSTSQPFGVAAHTSKAAWTFGFVPHNGSSGAVSYAYSIPSAGESHQATGTYTLSAPETDGTLHLALSVSDHVVFKGFDGNIPVNYKFDLVPSGATGCP